MRRTTSNERLIQNPHAFHDGSPPLVVPAFQSLRAISPRRLAAILVAPSRFWVTRLHIGPATLAGVEGNLAAISLILGKRDGFEVNACDRLWIELRVIQ
jgi:hypothetical protein